MTAPQPHGQTEGWHDDPFGRHEHRFFDGHKWTPHVRDGDRNGVDEPGGPVLEPGPNRSSLLDEGVFVVERFIDLGRRWSDRSILRPDGSRAGTLRRAAVPGRLSGRAPIAVHDPARNDVVELVDDRDRRVLTLSRPLGVTKSWVEIRDHEGHDAGRIVQQSLRHDTTTFAFIGTHGQFLGDLQSDNWVGWDLRIMDNHERQVATITRDWEGLDRSVFSSPDVYVVRITDSIHESLRLMVVACALSLEVAVRPDTLGP